MTKYIYLLFSISLVSISYSQEITIEKIWKNYEFYPQYARGFNSMADGISYTVRDENYNILKRNIEDLTNVGDEVDPEIIFSASDFTYSDYEFNSDESKILFLTNKMSIYRYSYSAVYYLYDLATKKLEPLDDVLKP